jgi:hypothetical protein
LQQLYGYFKLKNRKWWSIPPQSTGFREIRTSVGCLVRDCLVITIKTRSNLNHWIANNRGS